jgi:hypothetical protein
VPDALVDIMSVGVVIPLVVVQTGSSADHRRAFNVRRKEEDVDVASSHATSDTPQKYDCRPSPEQVNLKTASISKALSPSPSVHRNRDGENQRAFEYVVSQKQSRMTDGGTEIICSWPGK